MNEYNNLKEFLDAPGTVGLVVEGGGMRGVLSLSMLHALRQQGYGERFKIGTGSSSGALHIAYFLSEQTKTGIELYTHFLTDAEFIKYSRLNRIMDIGILENFMKNDPKTKFDTKTFRNNNTKLLVPLTRAADGKQVVFDLLKAKEPVHLLCAGASIPVLDNEVRNIEGVAYMDGGLTDILPIHLIEGMCDRILVLRTTDNRDYKPHKLLYGIFSKFVYHSSFKKGIDTTINSYKNKQSAFSRIDQNDVMVIHPPKNANVKRATRDKEKILESSQMTIDMMDKMLEKNYKH